MWGVAMCSDYFVEKSLELTASIPREIFSSDLSPIARLILLVVFAKGRGRMSLEELIGGGGCNISKHAWHKHSRELVHAGWLIRKNHGGGGRGVWLHERTFLSSPRVDILSGKIQVSKIST